MFGTYKRKTTTTEKLHLAVSSLDITDVLRTARSNVKTAVNLNMVYSYYEIGRIISEEEQRGNERAEYGKYIIKELSIFLTKEFGKGFSTTNLKQMR